MVGDVIDLILIVYIRIIRVNENAGQILRNKDTSTACFQKRTMGGLTGLLLEKLSKFHIT